MGEPVLDAMIDWSKVSKDMIKCREAYEEHVMSSTAALVRLLARRGNERLGLLQPLPPLPLVPESDDGWSEDELEADNALAALAFARVKEEAKAARENEAELRAKAEEERKAAAEAEAARVLDRPPDPPPHPPLTAFLTTEDKRALKQVSNGLSQFTKERMIRVKVKEMNTQRANRLHVFQALREMIGLSLGSRGVRRLALGVATLPVLLSLNLARNDAKDEGVLALSEALPRCPWLRHLNLSQNDFGDAATVALAKSCAKCKQLMLVDLSRNNIGDEGATALSVVMVPTCRSLAKLNLYRNQVSDVGAAAFSRALPQTTSLTNLDLRHNNMSAAGCEKLSGAVPFCTVQTTLRYTNVAMHMREYQALNVRYLPSEEEKRLKAERLEAARLAEIAAKEKAEFDAFVEEKQAAGRAARERKARRRGKAAGGDDPGSGSGADSGGGGRRRGRSKGRKKGAKSSSKSRDSKGARSGSKQRQRRRRSRSKGAAGT